MKLNIRLLVIAGAALSACAAGSGIAATDGTRALVDVTQQKSKDAKGNAASSGASKPREAVNKAKQGKTPKTADVHVKHKGELQKAQKAPANVTLKKQP